MFLLHYVNKIFFFSKVEVHSDIGRMNKPQTDKKHIANYYSRKLEGFNSLPTGQPLLYIN